MAYSKRPTHTKLRSAKSTKRRDETNMRRANAANKKWATEDISKLKRLQYNIDMINKAEAFRIDPYFRDLQLQGDWIIVKMFHENLIKHIDESDPDDIIVDAWFRQIDARQRTSDKPKWVPTPFPYIEKGVIVAISAPLTLKYYKDAELYKKATGEELAIPKVGDVVEVRSNYNSQWFKEQRYYIDKQAQCQDFVRNQTELRLNHFEGYFKFESIDLVAIDKAASLHPHFYADEEEPKWFTDTVNEINKKIEELNLSENFNQSDNSNTDDETPST